MNTLDMSHDKAPYKSTDTLLYSVCNNRPYLRSTAMRPKYRLQHCLECIMRV